MEVTNVKILYVSDLVIYATNWITMVDPHQRFELHCNDQWMAKTWIEINNNGVRCRVMGTKIKGPIPNSHGNGNKIDMSSPSVVEKMKDSYDHKLNFIAFCMTMTMRIRQHRQ